MKKIFAILVAALAVSVAGQSQDRKVGDVFGDGYINFKVISLNPNELEVTSSPNAVGKVVIPAEIEDYGIVYKVTKIGSEAFSLRQDENPNITGVEIPEGIVEIGWQAFMGCRFIKEIHFPSTLKKIGQAAFYSFSDKPSKLRKVISDAVVPPACGDMVFGSRFNAQEGNDRDSIVLYVPVGSVLVYRAEKEWDYFNYIVDIEGKESSTVTEEHYDPDPDNQAVESVRSSAVRTKKIIRDGQLIILRDDKEFNV